MNQTVTLPKGFGVLKKDLCTVCVHAEWFLMPITKQYGYKTIVVRLELAKLCYAKPLKQMFDKGLEAQRKHIQKIMFECKRFTNSGLLTGFISNPNNFEEIIKNMPKLGIPILKTLPDIKETELYLVKSAETTETTRNKYSAVRVGFVRVNADKKPVKGLESNKNGETHSTMLWIDKEVGSKTKLGSFIVGISDNTDEWVNKTIKVIAWGRGDREIKVVD